MKTNMYKDFFVKPRAPKNLVIRYFVLFINRNVENENSTRLSADFSEFFEEVFTRITRKTPKNKLIIRPNIPLISQINEQEVWYSR